jgi:muconate cycloisomerase
MITLIECSLVQLPVRRAHRWASLTEPVGSYVLVKIATDDGAVGWGEATALAQWGGDYGRYYGESPHLVMTVIRDHLAPVLLGCEIEDRPRLRDRLDATIKGHHYAKTAIDQALLDLVARRVGLPVYEFLGGRRRDTIQIAHSLGLMTVAEAVSEARQACDEGIRTIKIKVGEDFDRDLECVFKVRAAIGPDVDLVIDANQAWSPPATAERRIRALEPAKLRYIEQPVAGILEMAMVAERSDVPLMADESVWTAHDVVDVASRRAAQLVSIYTSKAGGMANAMALDAVAYAMGLGSNVNGSGETGVGNLANVHLACALQSLTEACVIPVTGLAEQRPTQVAGAEYLDDVLTEPFSYVDGAVSVPQGPGWGIPVNEEKVRKYCLERIEFHA